MTDRFQELVTKQFKDPNWRLANLYYIVDKAGRKVKFQPNWAQFELGNNLWYCNLILKARQLGISTYVCLLFLDRCLFNPTMAAGIVCHTREDSEHMFKRIKFAYDQLPPVLKARIIANVDSARELVFNNGSSIRVGTSMRGSTLQYLHISEFGKICAKFPDKAQEIITGSLNTIAPGQYVFIESTAEGREGYFYDLCKASQDMKKQGKELSKLDFRFHFFPWWKEPTYRIGSQLSITAEDMEYFESLETRGIKIDSEQKYWYAARRVTQGDNMLREFPSTPDEAFESALDGAYYSRQMSLARVEKRITRVPYDDSIPVHTAWDLGYNDLTSIWFFQVVGKEYHLIDYIEGAGESLTYWIGIVHRRPFHYGMHLAPHDILAHEYTSGMTRQASAAKLGMALVAVPKMDIIPGIDEARSILSRCWFDEVRCSKGIKALENYKKEWNDRLGCWASKPLHNQYSHGADAFRTLAVGKTFLDANMLQEGRALGYKGGPSGIPFGGPQTRWM